MKKTGYGNEIAVRPTKASVPDHDERESRTYYTDDVHDARKSLAHTIKHERKHGLGAKLGKPPEAMIRGLSRRTV